MIDPASDRVLITGAAGAIGTTLRRGFRERYKHLRLMDIRLIPDLADNEAWIQADVADAASLERALEGVAGLVHLAGSGQPENLDSLVHVNLIGLVRIFDAARAAGVRRIVFASSNHAFGMYPITERVTPAHPPRPDSLYGAFKLLGETLLRYYYDKHRISSVSLRIGTFRPEPIDQRSLATWLSPADMVQLADKSLIHPNPGCLVINGYSANTRIKTYDPNWDTLGYRPLDDAERHRDALKAKGIDIDGPWEWPEHGGTYPSEPW
ncbi:MAG: NAD(P)-dependent oxidoreductase [Proteobacteria bacterium]|nr:NAD(P)-dependent oxidoreductase [Pseudomonadota bacterium]MBI3498635.1 NAD(P)-dependent oxidoreductase [Pseudomonadota bacterium]